HCGRHERMCLTEAGRVAPRPRRKAQSEWPTGWSATRTALSVLLEPCSGVERESRWGSALADAQREGGIPSPRAGVHRGVEQGSADAHASHVGMDEKVDDEGPVQPGV